jgi:hypothetical protein
MKIIFKLIVLIFGLALQTISLNAAINLKYERPDLPESIRGTMSYISISGDIEAGDALRLERFIFENNVSPFSIVFLNSPGGSLYEGMSIGRVIRKYRLNTQIGYFSEFGTLITKDSFCYSSCSLAYIGGVWRYKSADSFYGIHRFYSPVPSVNAEQTAQAASGNIVEYFAEMGVASDLFVQMSRTPSVNMLILNDEDLVNMGVVNNGVLPTVWDIRTSSGAFYVVGERATQWGLQKSIFACDEASKQIHFLVIFDTQGRNDELLQMKSIRLSIDRDTFSFDLTSDSDEVVSFTNNLANASFALDRQQWQYVRNSDTIGVYFQFASESPYFLGFDGMPTADAKSAFDALNGYCS